MKQNKIFVTLLLIAGLCLCSCAQLAQDEANNQPDNKTEIVNNPPVNGGFHPGVFIRNRVRDFNGFLAKAAKNSPNENVQELDQSSADNRGSYPTEEKVEDEPRDVIVKGGPPNSIVHIKAGTYKIKYVVLSQKGKK